MKRLPPREGYDLYAKDYRKDHPLLDSFMEGAEGESFFGALEGLLADRPTVRALDAGCGDGRTLGRWVRGIEKRGLTERVELWGADFSPKMIEAARGRVKGPRYTVLDLSSGPALTAWTADHGAVDLVAAFFLLVHFDRPERFFACMDLLLAPGGRLILNTIPQPSAPELRAQGKPIVIEAWDHTAEEVAFCGAEAGFVLDHQQDYFEAGKLISTLMEWTKPGPESLPDRS